MATCFNQTLGPGTVGKDVSPEEQATRGLAEVAKRFGVKPEEIDQAIRAWGEKAQDPYDVALAQFYQRNYDAAIPDLEGSRRIRQERALKSVAELVDVDMLLGQSFFWKQEFPKAAETLQEANRYRPNDNFILAWLGNSLMNAGDLVSAETALRESVGISKLKFGPEHENVSAVLNSLGLVLLEKGELPQATNILREARAPSSTNRRTMQPGAS
jgi:tetratricopeptide (TPR) repeat protein